MPSPWHVVPHMGCRYCPSCKKTLPSFVNRVYQDSILFSLCWSHGAPSTSFAVNVSLFPLKFFALHEPQWLEFTPQAFVSGFSATSQVLLYPGVGNPLRRALQVRRHNIELSVFFHINNKTLSYGKWLLYQSKTKLVVLRVLRAVMVSEGCWLCDRVGWVIHANTLCIRGFTSKQLHNSKYAMECCWHVSSDLGFRGPQKDSCFVQ